MLKPCVVSLVSPVRVVVTSAVLPGGSRTVVVTGVLVEPRPGTRTYYRPAATSWTLQHCSTAEGSTAFHHCNTAVEMGTVGKQTFPDLLSNLIMHRHCYWCCTVM